MLYPNFYTLAPGWKGALVPAAGAAASVLLYRRFGYQYAVLVALIFLAYVPGHLAASGDVRRMLLGGFFLIGLLLVRSARTSHRQDYLDEEYGVVEAMLWLALYLTVNLQLTAETLWPRWAMGGVSLPVISRPFY